MPTVGVSLAANTQQTITIPGNSTVLPGRIVVTQVNATTASTAVNTDGAPLAVMPTVTNTATDILYGNQQFLPGVPGNFVVFTPLYKSGQPVLPITIQLKSAGAPDISVSW